MVDPDNHTLRLLREIRSQGDGLRKDFEKLRGSMDKGFTEIRERIDDLAQMVVGEGVLGRYAAADVDKRLEALEKRVTKLERTR